MYFMTIIKTYFCKKKNQGERNFPRRFGNKFQFNGIIIDLAFGSTRTLRNNNLEVLKFFVVPFDS